MEKKEEKQEAQYLADVSVYIDALMKTFAPASSPAETTHWFSTEEVVEAIREIDPDAKINVSMVFSALRDAGFDFCNRPISQAISFKWMFREKGQ